MKTYSMETFNRDNYPLVISIDVDISILNSVLPHDETGWYYECPGAVNYFLLHYKSENDLGRFKSIMGSRGVIIS